MKKETKLKAFTNKSGVYFLRMGLCVFTSDIQNSNCGYPKLEFRITVIRSITITILDSNSGYAELQQNISDIQNSNSG